MSKTKTTEKKTNTTKKSAKQKLMSYPQAIALTNALFHSGQTKATLSEQIDKLKNKGKGGMKPEARAKWLEEHGNEPASYGQCKMYAFGLKNDKTPYDTASQLIDQLDKKSGYVRQPKAEKTVNDANDKASKVAEEKAQEQASLLDLEEADSDVAKA